MSYKLKRYRDKWERRGRDGESTAKSIFRYYRKKSPVQKAIKLIWRLANEKPNKTAKTLESKASSALILTHLLGLMESTGLINCRGFHSSAITLLRAIEDATDCFAVVGINANAANKWQDGKLKSSDTAKLRTPNFLLDDVDSSEYRKTIRTALNKFSHCAPEQMHWNIYLESINAGKCTMELNTKPMVIDINAYYDVGVKT